VPPVPVLTGVKAFATTRSPKSRHRLDAVLQTGNLRGVIGHSQDKVVGEAARTLFADAQGMLARIIGEKWLGAATVIGCCRQTASATTSRSIRMNRGRP
jgi:5-methyltetrahydrofolate--homocysteine methyltransferase